MAAQKHSNDRETAVSHRLAVSLFVVASGLCATSACSDAGSSSATAGGSGGSASGSAGAGPARGGSNGNLGGAGGAFAVPGSAGAGAAASGGASSQGGMQAGSAGLAGSGAGGALIGSGMGGGGGVGNVSGGSGTAGTGSAGLGSSAGSAGAPALGPSTDPALRMKCSGTNPVSCHFGGDAGNYDVTVELGGTAAGNTIVHAETNRVLLGAVATSAGQSRRYGFSVNVRKPEGQPIQDVPAGTDGLDLYFLGNAGALPQISALGYAKATSPFVLYIAGDSTVCDQSSTEYGGWGQQIPQYFGYPVSVSNYSDSGESSGSFLNSNSLFGAITSRLKANDWVLIQFGHNDKEVTASAFHDNITSLVSGVKAKNAFPVLITPISRAQFTGNMVSTQHVNGANANLPQIIKQVASEQNVPLLDLTARTTTWLNELGPNGWQRYHANGTDVTHTNPAGAAVIAGFVRDLIKQANLTELVNRLR